MLLWFALLYNALVRGRNTCNESWADIDTELKRRYDLIPNLISSVRGYAKHEREVLERVVQARTAAMASHGLPKTQAGDENKLIESLRQLFAVAESYPDLKANQSFLSLQAELANTEDRIQRSRRFYNANVRDDNNRLEILPSAFVAQALQVPEVRVFRDRGRCAASAAGRGVDLSGKARCYGYDRKQQMSAGADDGLLWPNRLDRRRGCRNDVGTQAEIAQSLARFLPLGQTPLEQPAYGGGLLGVAVVLVEQDPTQRDDRVGIRAAGVGKEEAEIRWATARSRATRGRSPRSPGRNGRPCSPAGRFSARAAWQNPIRGTRSIPTTA